MFTPIVPRLTQDIEAVIQKQSVQISKARNSTCVARSLEVKEVKLYASPPICRPTLCGRRQVVAAQSRATRCY